MEQLALVVNTRMYYANGFHLRILEGLIEMSKRKCNKFEHDKYYTPQHVVDYVVKKTIEIVGSDLLIVS